jgi:hypothetical protein
MLDNDEDVNMTPKEEDGSSDIFNCNEHNYMTSGRMHNARNIFLFVNYLYQLPLMPSSSRVPLNPISSTSPKLIPSQI